MFRSWFSCALFSLILASNAMAAKEEVLDSELGPTAVQSDSACAAHVPGKSLNEYIARCARLIEELKDTLDKCGRVAELPMSGQQRYDAEKYCSEFNLRLTRVQLAAAYNDRAYFLIQCRGSENYKLALADLKKAMDLMEGVYWLAQQNRAVTYALLGQYKLAEADFRSLLDALDHLESDVANGRPAETPVFIRPATRAELRLGRGMALIRTCDFKSAQDELVAAESLTRGPIGTQMRYYALSLFGQGITWKMKGWKQDKVSRSQAPLSKSERERVGRYAGSLKDTGDQRMNAARELLENVEQIVAEFYKVDERQIQTQCFGGKATS